MFKTTFTDPGVIPRGDIESADQSGHAEGIIRTDEEDISDGNKLLISGLISC